MERLTTPFRWSSSRINCIPSCPTPRACGATERATSQQARTGASVASSWPAKDTGPDHRDQRIAFEHILPVDSTIMGAPARAGRETRDVHLHGGLVPWISDGGPHTWFDPSGNYGASAVLGGAFANICR